MKTVEVYTCNHLGDSICLLGACHHFRKVYPDFMFFNGSRYSSIFKGSEDFTDDRSSIEMKIEINYRKFGNDNVATIGNLMNGMIIALCRQLNCPDIPVDDSRCCFIHDSILEPIDIGIDDYIIMNANCQDCSSVKLWPYYQNIVDEFRYTQKFVLIGGTEQRDITLPISGQNVIDMRGKTTFGQLFTLVKNAKLVLSPSSAVIHAASAFGVRCICIIGAAEPIGITRYPNVIPIWSYCDGRKNHKNGYSGFWGCRHFKTTDPRSCERVCMINDRQFSKCMYDIRPEIVIDSINYSLLNL